MAKSKSKQLLACIFIITLFGCTSTKENPPETVIIEEPVEFITETELPAETESEEKVELWHTPDSINEITGTWETENGTFEFPVFIDGKEYLSITSTENKDSSLWRDYSLEKDIPITTLWDYKNIYIPQIYSTDYPIADENGTQLGLTLENKCFIDTNSALISSKKQLLIPILIVEKNLSFFKLSQDSTKLKTEGTFRFYSSKFNNIDENINISLIKPAAPDKYGLVLSGGGGKGAYEVGVWKALLEYGIAQKTQAISGTSVGGLNSALFAVESYNNIENIWISKVPDKLTQNDALISQEGLSQIISSIDLNKIQKIKFPQSYVTTVRNKFILAKLIKKNKPGQYATRFNLNEEEDIQQIEKKLLATSAFPIVCPAVKLADGYEYSDGGNEAVGGDNTPIDPIVENQEDINKIFIVYLAQDPKRKIREIDYDTKSLIHIIPSIELGNILEGTTNFTSSRIRLLIKYGYDDTVKVLQQLGYFPVSSYWF